MPRILLTALLFLVASPMLTAQPSAEKEIRAVMDKQVADWNRGDLDAFATGYKNAPDILFIGVTIHRGYAEMLAHYKERYATRAKMGTLSFSNLEIQPLDAHFVTATGHYHLELADSEGGNADGYYLLVLEKTPGGWKIVRDDTTSLPSTGAH